MSCAKIEAIESRIDRLKSKFIMIGSFLPGSLTKQFNVCGTLGCRCKDPANPQKHGPYYQLGFYKDGKHSTTSIPDEQAKQIKAEIENYRRAKKLMDDLVGLQLELAILKIKIKKSEKAAVRKKP